MEGSPHSTVTIYKEWINSILCEEGIQVSSLTDLSNFFLLPKLYDILKSVQYDRPECKIAKPESSDQVTVISDLLQQLRTDGVRVNLLPSDLVNGEFHSLLELLWALLLNYGIHLPGPVKSFQRTQSIGTKLLLQWCSELLGGACFDYRLSITENMEKDILHNIINKVTALVSQSDEPEPCDYHEAIADAERKLGISSNLLRAFDSHSEDLAVTIYISLLRRKRELILKGSRPTHPCVLVKQRSQTTSVPLNVMSERNERTQEVLKEIEKQLGLFQTDREMTSLLTNGNAYHNQQLNGGDIRKRLSISDEDDEDSAVTSEETLSKVPTTSSSYDPKLQIDLNKLKSRHKSGASGSSHQKMRVSISSEQCASSVDFTQLFQQMKEKESEERVKDGLVVQTDTGCHIAGKYCKEEDDDSTSPKSAPTDEGFGTFTKTTPRDKDSDGSGDHTDCDVDHLEETCSITEWWDKIEVPTEMATIDTFKQPDNHVDLAMNNANCSMDLMEDELMFMIDNIALTGMKASSSLASAQETELRLLHILKERDDLVLSYHTALKELSKLTARIKDENHLLRRELNMTDLSHSEIVLALEEQASNGRQLAISLQDDLTDTEMNVVARLREDKLILQDRLAALEHQYNTDIAKWKTELSLYKSEASNTGGRSAVEEELRRENEELRKQLQDAKKMFDVTISQTQDECSNYLITIDELKKQISQSKSPVSESQIEALAVHQTEMGKLYESVLSSLESDNCQLQSTVEELQSEVEKLTNEQKSYQCVAVGTDKLTVDRAIDTNRSVVEKQCGTDNTTFNKSVETDEDGRISQMNNEIMQLRQTLCKMQTEYQNLENQKDSLSDNHKQLCTKLADVESQLQLTQHKLTTLQAVHELVLTKNENLEKIVSDNKRELSSQSMNSDRIHQQLTAELEHVKNDSNKLTAELNVCRQQLHQLQMENSTYKRREVELNTELTQLTLERSNLQGRVNTLSSDQVQQKAQYMSQVMKIKHLETSNAKLESEVFAFKNESLELFDQLEMAKQEKDDLSGELTSLHKQLAEGIESWQHKYDQQKVQYDQVMENMDSDLRQERKNSENLRSEVTILSTELKCLEKQMKDVKEISENDRKQLTEVLKTAKLDSNSDNALQELNEQLKSLKQQVAEFQFTTTHFRTENSQLQLRVNQLEELNKSIEQRNSILEKELSTVQASLDDSLQSQDQQLDILDLSVSELNSIDEVPQMKNYLLSARKQVERMQNKRAKTNLEYSRKISQMEKLLKENRKDDDNNSINDAVLASTSNQSSNILAVKAPVQLTNHVKLTETPSNGSAKSSLSSTDSFKEKYTPYTTQTSTSATSVTSYRLPAVPSSHPLPHVRSSSVSSISQKLSDRDTVAGTGDDNGDVDSLSLKVRLLTDGCDSSTPTSVNNQQYSLNAATLAYRSEKSDSNLPAAVKMSSGIHQNGDTEQHYIASIETENAALRAELDLINSDRHSLQKHLVDQSGKHNALNETLDELERSLEEIHDNNKLLRDTLQQSNEFIQTQLLEPKSSSYNRTSSPKPASSAYRSGGITTSQSYRSSSVPLNRLTTSYTPSNYSGHELDRYFGDNDKLGWSVNGDRHLTSSTDFNKLQQTNVQNYETLLNSDTNSKSPSRHSTSARKSTDLNRMIQHSLSQINQLSSSAAVSPFGAESTIHNGMTSTPIKARLSNSRRDTTPTPTYHTGTITPRDSDMRERFYTANQFSSNLSSYESPLQSLEVQRTAFHRYLPGESIPHYQSYDERIHRKYYNDGGPEPDEPKSVLPEPVRSQLRRYSTETE